MPSRGICLGLGVGVRRVDAGRDIISVGLWPFSFHLVNLSALDTPLVCYWSVGIAYPVVNESAVQARSGSGRSTPTGGHREGEHTAALVENGVYFWEEINRGVDRFPPAVDAYESSFVESSGGSSFVSYVEWDP